MTPRADLHELAQAVSERYGLDQAELFWRRSKRAIAARAELYYRAQQLSPKPSNPEIAEAFGVTEGAVRQGVKRWASGKGCA